jgi:putative nucleotide binding protein
MNTGNRKTDSFAQKQLFVDKYWAVGRMEKRYEEYAYVLDYLPRGRPTAKPTYRAGALVQLVGEEFFTLLEATAKNGVTLKLYDRVYVGKDARREITYIIGRIGFDELTSAAKVELPAVIERIVLNREAWFIYFFNTAQAITPRMHALELIPGIGKKYMWQIINERGRVPFKNFGDLQQRANIPSPAKLVAKRIMEELSGESKYRLFTRAP